MFHYWKIIKFRFLSPCVPVNDKNTFKNCFNNGIFLAVVTVDLHDKAVMTDVDTVVTVATIDEADFGQAEKAENR